MICFDFGSLCFGLHLTSKRNGVVAIIKNVDQLKTVKLVKEHVVERKTLFISTTTPFFISSQEED